MVLLNGCLRTILMHNSKNCGKHNEHWFNAKHGTSQPQSYVLLIKQ